MTRIVSHDENFTGRKQLRLLIAEYADCLGVDLSFQNFEEELSGFPDGNALPDSSLLLAVYGNQITGYVALRILELILAK